MPSSCVANLLYEQPDTLMATNASTAACPIRSRLIGLSAFRCRSPMPVDSRPPDGPPPPLRPPPKPPNPPPPPPPPKTTKPPPDPPPPPKPPPTQGTLPPV